MTGKHHEDLSIIDDEIPIESNRVNLNIKKELEMQGIISNLIQPEMICK